MTSLWSAGAATATFSVPQGTVLGGYADRDGAATGTHDELEISALVLTAGDHTLCLVTADVVAVDYDLTAEIAQRAGIAPDSLVLAASHTHSGPLGVPKRLHPASETTQDPNLRQRFVDMTIATIANATANSVPATLDHGECHVPGVWSNRNGLDLPSDDRVRWLRVRSAETDRFLALAFLVPCHPTVLGAWNREVSADLHGGIRRALRRLLPPEDAANATLLSLTGAAGDISTRFTRRASSFAEVDRLGDTIAIEMIGSLDGGTSLSPRLRSARTREVSLPVRTFDRTEADRALEDADIAWRTARDDAHTSEADRRRAYTVLQGAQILQRMTDLLPISVSIGGHCLGEDLTMITVPGELFNSIGAAIERHPELPGGWVIGYANGYAGYVVDQRAHETGTYEALASPLAPEATDIVLSTANALLTALAHEDES